MEIKCKRCEKIFYISPSRIGKRVFCSIVCKSLFQKGKTAWNKGRKRWWNSYSFKKNSVPWNKGKIGLQKMSEKTKIKMSESHKGEKSYQWKGGITPINKLQRIKFRKEIQKKVLERDDYTCQICGTRGVDLQVDHIQSWAEYVELRFDINNCRTLCAKCHYQITFGKPMPESVQGWGHNLLKGSVALSLA